ncbi:MAG: glycosyltransferase family 1 protein [Verrucomicrobiota bacterium]
MRVGVVVEQMGAEYGGGHTFREEIYRALLRLQGELSQEYVFVVKGSAPDYLESQSYLSLEVPSPPDLSARSLLRRIWDKIFPPEPPDLRPRIGEALPAEEVDFLYFCYPDVITDTGVPVLSTIWDLAHRYAPYFPELTVGDVRVGRELHFQKLALHSDLLIVGTERGQNELTQYFGVDPHRQWKIKHPTPADALHFTKSDGEDTRESKEPYFVYPSQYWPHKNHVTLLKAWAELRSETGSPPKLYFTGSNQGNQEHVRTVLQEMNLEDCVEMTGFLEREDLLSLVRDSTAIVFPCLFGPENLPPLEAGALGVPTIIADVPGFREQLGDSAFFIEDPMDPSEWASAVTQLINEPDTREHLAAQARERAEDYTVDHFVRELDEHLERFSRIRDLWAKQFQA